MAARVHLPTSSRVAPRCSRFYKVNCPVCQLTLPYLERIEASGRLPVFAISQNDADDSRAFQPALRRYHAYAARCRGERLSVSNAFGISSVPTLFLVEPDGAVARVIEGWQKKEIEKLGAEAGVNPFREGDSVPDWESRLTRPQLGSRAEFRLE